MKLKITTLLSFIILVPTLLFGQRASTLQKQEPSNRSYYANFGQTIAMTDDMMLVGAPYESLNDNYTAKKNRAGAVYCYKKLSNGTWSEFQKIVPAIRADMDNFGYSIALSGNTLVVSAPRMSTGYKSGQVYVFEFNGELWIEKEILKVEESENDDNFGYDVAINGNLIVIGSPTHNYTGNGTYKENTGAIYVFSKSNNRWNFNKKITPSDARANDWFGSEVACAGNQIIAGAPNKAIKVNQNFNGAVYAFTLQVESYTEQKIISDSPIENAFFGKSIAIENNTMIIGSPGDEFYQSEFYYDACGSAYIYYLENGVWKQSQKMYALQKSDDAGFGNAIALKGDRILIGSSEANYGRGYAHLFSKDQENLWFETDHINYNYLDYNDNFGSSVALGNNLAAIGARNDSEDKFENDYKYAAGSAFTFQHKSDELVIGEISPQILCNSDTVRIPFKVFNAKNNSPIFYEFTSSNEEAILAENIFIEDNRFIVIKPNYVSEKQTTTIQLAVNQNQGSDQNEFFVEVNRVYTNWEDNVNLCFGDSIYLNNAYQTKAGTYCDTNFFSNGCYSLTCRTITNNDAIDTSITLISSNSAMANNATYDTYHWVSCEDGETAIGLIGLPTYTATSNGWYAVDITSNECTIRSNCYYLSNALPTSIGVNAIGNLNVTIRKGTKSLTVENLHEPNTKLVIYNSLGQMVLQKNIENHAQISLNTMPNGIYVATLIGEKTLKSVKFSL